MLNSFSCLGGKQTGQRQNEVIGVDERGEGATYVNNSLHSSGVGRFFVSTRLDEGVDLELLPPDLIVQAVDGLLKSREEKIERR